jgi:H+/Cl- antiporter ClcA
MIAWATRNDGDRAVWYWGILAIILLGLSLDETAGVHELISKQLRSILKSEGVLRYPWVIPGALFVLIFIAAYMWFFIKLPPKIRGLMGLEG